MAVSRDVPLIGKLRATDYERQQFRRLIEARREIGRSFWYSNGGIFHRR